MASPLHDNPRSKTEKKDDKKPERDASRSEAVTKEPGPNDEEKKPDLKDQRDERPPKDGEAMAAEEGGPKDKFMDGMKAIQKRQESERRDFHGNMREQMRQIGSRHNKEIADHFALNFGGGEKAGGESEKPAAEEE